MRSALVLAAGASFVSASLAPVAHLAQHRRLALVRRAVTSSDAGLAEGSLSAANGCASFWLAAGTDTCDTVLAAVEGLTAAAFANANPGVQCPALRAGTSYCVAGPTQGLQFGSTDLTRVRPGPLGTI